MENLAPQSNENKCITIVDGQDTFDFDKNIDDSGNGFVNYSKTYKT